MTAWRDRLAVGDDGDRGVRALLSRLLPPREREEADASPRRWSRAAKVLTLSLAALVLLYGILLITLAPRSSGQAISVDRLLQATWAGNVRSARFLDEDARITGKLVEEGRTVKYWTSYPSSDVSTNDLLRTFLTSKTVVTVDSQSTKALVRFVAQFLLPLVIFANLFALLIAVVRPGEGGGASEFKAFSRLGDKRLGAEQRSATTFANVAGADEAVAELGEVRDYLRDPESFARMGALPPKGVLIAGPPGCGKTLLARAVAGEADAAFYSISGSNFVESLVGVGAARVRDLFQQARANSPAIVFIDELDAVGRQRGAGLGGGHDEREQTLNEMLVQMDGFSPREGVAVLAATNRPDILDPALLRAGRFDRHVTVERPDREGRLEILRLHAVGKRLADPAHDLPEIARNSPGFTGADLANVLNEAALLAVRERAPAISQAHLDEAVERVLSGPRRKGTLISDEDKQRIAYHEAGHAVVATALGKGEQINKLSVVARGRGVGHLALISEDRTLLTRHEMEAQIAVALAGVAAEELVLGESSTGAEVDLERATHTARDMAGRYGMSSRLGRARVLQAHGEVFLGRDYLSSQEVSQPTLEALDAEVRRLLDEQEQAARSILTTHTRSLDLLAGQLMAYETIQGTDLDRALDAIAPRIEASAGFAEPYPDEPFSPETAVSVAADATVGFGFTEEVGVSSFSVGADETTAAPSPPPSERETVAPTRRRGLRFGRSAGGRVGDGHDTTYPSPPPPPSPPGGNDDDSAGPNAPGLSAAEGHDPDDDLYDYNPPW